MGGMPAHNPLDVYGGMGLPRVFPTGAVAPSGPDTFTMPRRQVLWPQLADSDVGNWTWLASANNILGGYYYNSSAALNDRLNFENVAFFGGNVKIKILHTTAGSGGLISVYWGTDKLGEFDNRSGGTTYNVVTTVDLGTVSAGRKQLSLRVDGTTGASYILRIQQVELIQQTGTNTGTGLDDLPWRVDAPPIHYNLATGSPTLTQITSAQWGSYINLTSAIDQYAEYKVWLAQGTYDLKAVVVGRGNGGIATVSVNGSSVGTFDTYSSSVIYNSARTISSISIPSTGVHTIRLTAATKNASSSDYFLSLQWMQFQKSTSTGAITESGSNYGVATTELWPWFADTTNSNTFTLGGGYLHYGAFNSSSPSINDSQEYAIGIQPGTYDVTMFNRSDPASGIAHLALNGGSDLDTVDLYSLGTLFNQRIVLSGSLTSGDLAISMDSKNASSTNYHNYLTMARLVRTGV